MILKTLEEKECNLNSLEIKKLIFDQYEILQKIAQIHYGTIVTHIKPHGALNNMACEDIRIGNNIG